MHASFSATRPGGPALLYPNKNLLYFLPVHYLDVNCEFYFATALVEITAQFTNNSAEASGQCLFVLPLRGTVTSVQYEVKHASGVDYVRKFGSHVRHKPNLEEKEEKKEPKKKQKEEKLDEIPPYSSYIPDLFRLPIPDVQSGATVTVEVQYTETLNYRKGQYHFYLPVTFDQRVLAGRPIFDVLSIQCTVYGSHPNLRCKSVSHQLEVTQPKGKKKYKKKGPLKSICFRVVDVERPERDSGRASGSLKNSGRDSAVTPPKPKNDDFHLSYGPLTAGDPILLTEPDQTGGEFLLYLPPDVVFEAQEDDDNPAGGPAYQRLLVFLVDRSGSMKGPPFTETVRAIKHALCSLTPDDRFMLVVFDEKPEAYQPRPIQARRETIEAAISWMSLKEPFVKKDTPAQTDIMGALKFALDKRTGTENDEEGYLIPFLVLITDGSVRNELAICSYVEEQCKITRILTIGIGSYCNWYFLRMLAQIGRGFFASVLTEDSLVEHIARLTDMVRAPVYTNLAITKSFDVDLYPDPVPDLFKDAPLVIGGSWTGAFPEKLVVSATRADNAVLHLEVTPVDCGFISVKKILARERLEGMTARAWMDGDVEARKIVADLSMSTGVPCAYTDLITFEMNSERPSIPKVKAQSARGINEKKTRPLRASSERGITASLDETEMAGMLTPGGTSPMVNTMQTLGTGSHCFGDIPATLSNLQVVLLALGGAASLVASEPCSVCACLACCCCCCMTGTSCLFQ